MKKNNIENTLNNQQDLILIENDIDTKITTFTFLLISIASIGLTFYLFYDYLMEYKYYYNRRQLYKYLKQLKSLKIKNIFTNIQIIQISPVYTLWLYPNNNFTLNNELTDTIDIIGLFNKSPFEKRIIKKIITQVNYLLN